MEKICGRFATHSNEKESSQFFCVYIIDENGKITLEKANDTYRELENCDQKEYGANYFLYQHLYSVKRWIEKQKPGHEDISYIRKSVSAQGTTLYWKVTLRFIENRIECTGQNIFIEEYLKNCDNFLMQKDGTPLLEGYNVSFLLAPTDEGRYKVETACETGAAYLEIASQEEPYYIDALFRPESQPRTHGFLAQCIEKQMPVAFYDIYAAGVYEIFLHITLVPLIHTRKTCVLLLAKTLAKDIFSFGELVYPQSVESLFNTQYFGVCILNCTNQQDIFVEHSNNCFAEIFLKNNFSLQDLITTSFFQKSLKGGTAGGSVAVNNCGGHPVMHYANTIPAFKEGKVTKIMVMLLPDGSVSLRCRNLLEQLTPRETQIVCLIIAGYTNRYIAATLSISEGTVKKIVYNVYRKLSVSSRVDLLKRVLNI